jgi:transcriptional regulator with XRE-family HTH domain
MNRVNAPTTQRRQLIDFLKGCRARLTPTQVGLPDTNRRRTPGLRREDVAALAGVSVTWYTWLEQGRDIQVSADVLERISTTLRMSPDEREYLFALVQHRPAPPTPARTEIVSPAIRRMLDALAVPAILLTARWDVIAWNSLIKVIRDYGALPAERRNLLRILLVDDGLWALAEVVGTHEAIVTHPRAGLTFEHSSYVPEGSPKQRLIIFTPCNEMSAAKVREAIAETKSGARRSSQVN